MNPFAAFDGNSPTLRHDVARLIKAERPFIDDEDFSRIVARIVNDIRYAQGLMGGAS